MNNINRGEQGFVKSWAGTLKTVSTCGGWEVACELTDSKCCLLSGDQQDSKRKNKSRQSFQKEVHNRDLQKENRKQGKVRKKPSPPSVIYSNCLKSCFFLKQLVQGASGELLLEWNDCGFSFYVCMCLACSIYILISIICHSVSCEFVLAFRMVKLVWIKICKSSFFFHDRVNLSILELWCDDSSLLLPHDFPF